MAGRQQGSIFALPDLVEEEAAKRRIPPRKLCVEVLTAIAAGQLRPKLYPEAAGLHGSQLEDFKRWWAIKGPSPLYDGILSGTLEAAKRGHLPDTYRWMKGIGLSRKEFRTWLDRPRKRPSATQALQAVKEYCQEQERSGYTPTAESAFARLRSQGFARDQVRTAMKGIGRGQERGRPNKPAQSTA